MNQNTAVFLIFLSFAGCTALGYKYDADQIKYYTQNGYERTGKFRTWVLKDCQRRPNEAR